MNQLKRIFLSCLLVFGLGLMAAPSFAYADAAGDACAAIGGGANCDQNPTGSTSIDSVVTTIVNILSLVVGIVAVIMIIIGGLRFITSAGDANGVSSAKNTIIYALVGLVVVALAQFIVKFVLAKIT